MPSSDRACRPENELFNGSLGTIFLLYPVLSSRPRNLIGRRFGSRSPPGVPLPPCISLLTCAEAREVAAAGGAAIRRGSQAQAHGDGAGRAIVLQAPGGQLLAIAARTAGVSPRAGGPHAGLPAGPAALATQGIDAHDGLQILGETAPVGHMHVARTALGTGKLHARMYIIINVFPRMLTRDNT